uniref:EF-hand domain-containing protein n=1 Tax=Coccolithus braarudii TaxID=221442 RepID=A0A7S0L3G9_9EUKA
MCGVFILACLVYPGVAAGTSVTVKPPRRGLICRQYDKVFEAADSNSDGAIDEQEVYELVLKVCVVLNRQAPIKAPTKASVLAVYQSSDGDGDGRLSKYEFQRIAATIFIGGIGRVIAHKVISLLIAPLLAAELARRLDRWQCFYPLSRRVLPASLHARVLNKAFFQTALTVVFVTSLSGLVLDLIDMLGNMLYGVNEAERGKRPMRLVDRSKRASIHST